MKLLLTAFLFFAVKIYVKLTFKTTVRNCDHWAI